jgi:hypothetical protein
MDIVIILIVLLLLFGGGGGLYWGMGAGWGIGPIGLIVAVLVIAFLLNGYRGRRGHASDIGALITQGRSVDTLQPMSP